MTKKISFIFVACVALLFIAANTVAPTYYKPAKLQYVDNLCQYLPHIDSIWGLNMQGKREPLDSLAIMLNIDRVLTCNYQLSEMGSNVIRLKLSNMFRDPQLLDTYMLKHAERYRNVNFNGEINANLFVAPDGTYMGHEVLQEGTFKVFSPLAKVFPFYMLHFTPAQSDKEAIMDTVKVIIKVQMEEELFIKQ